MISYSDQWESPGPHAYVGTNYTEYYMASAALAAKFADNKFEVENYDESEVVQVVFMRQIN